MPRADTSKAMDTSQTSATDVLAAGEVNKARDNTFSPEQPKPSSSTDYHETEKSTPGECSAFIPVYLTSHGGNAVRPSWSPVQSSEDCQLLVPCFPPAIGAPVSGGKDSTSNGGSHVIIIQQAAPAPVSAAFPGENATFRCHLVAACLVFCVCDSAFGGIALALAVVARGAVSAGRTDEARKLGVASACSTIAGLLLGLVTWTVFVLAAVLDEDDGASDCRYTCDGQCFRFRTGLCSLSKYNNVYRWCYCDGYCYYN